MAFLRTNITFNTFVYLFILMSKISSNIIQRALQKYCISDPFSTKSQQMYLKVKKKLYFLGYNQLFDIITTPSGALFVSSDEFVDACGIPHWVLLLKKISHRFWSETSLGWFGGEWNGNITLAITLTQRSLLESNGTIWY